MHHLEDGIDEKTVGVVAILVTLGNHQQAKTNNVGSPWAPSNWPTILLAPTDDKPSKGGKKIGHGGCGLSEIALIRIENKFIHEIISLRCIGLLALRNPGLASSYCEQAIPSNCSVIYQRYKYYQNGHFIATGSAFPVDILQ